MSFFRKWLSGQAPSYFFDPKKPKGERWSSGAMNRLSLRLGLQHLLNPLTISVGDEVAFPSGARMETGKVVAVDGDDCTVHLEDADVVVKRQRIVAVTREA
ncbi:MAG: hypothetical protein DI536_34840 [Archangium gephyra]|uniref:Uncharacterized protein n=1 Tax=Archangium gephyra TaxID=48 RepID=A0A2W5SNF3_9BACT|nr:MAG: hypothetical protein DI536_34840 [Archangium gephyra]